MAEEGTETTTTETTDTTPDPKDQEIKRLTQDATKYHRRAQEAETRLSDLEGKSLSEEDRTLFATMKAERAEADPKGRQCGNQQPDSAGEEAPDR